MRPIEPQACPIVCLNHTTGSSYPDPGYSGLSASSDWRLACHAGVSGKMTSKAYTGRGMRESKSGSVRLYTSCHCRSGERPSLRERAFITSGLFSASEC